jgi:hypothetical protein
MWSNIKETFPLVELSYEEYYDFDWCRLKNPSAFREGRETD